MSGIRLGHKARVEREWGLPLRLVLLQLAYQRGLDQIQIAEELGVAEGTVASWFVREGIQVKTLATEQAKRLLEAAS